MTERERGTWNYLVSLAIWILDLSVVIFHCLWGLCRLRPVVPFLGVTSAGLTLWIYDRQMCQVLAIYRVDVSSVLLWSVHFSEKCDDSALLLCELFSLLLRDDQTRGKHTFGVLWLYILVHYVHTSILSYLSVFDTVDKNTLTTGPHNDTFIYFLLLSLSLSFSLPHTTPNIKKMIL